jgi:VanZ family protein
MDIGSDQKSEVSAAGILCDHDIIWLFIRTRRRTNMEPVARRRWKQIALLAAAIGLYWLAMFAGTHLPLQTTPPGDPYSLDKLQHITAFAIFAALLCYAGSTFGVARLRLYVGVIGLIAGYAAIDEFSQQFVPERTPDFFDWLADMAGAATGIVAFAAIRRIHDRRQLCRKAATESTN